MSGGPRWRSRASVAPACPLFVLVPLLLAALGLASSCSQVRTASPDIVLIVLDTVRRDHLSSYGYERDTSPHLSKLRDEGRIYTNAYATGGWTVPSHASMFTGLYPVRHRATQERHVLDKGFVTLAEHLQFAGYETVGITGNAMITDASGFSQGFDVYHQSWVGARKQARDLITLEWVEEFLSARDSAKPLFLFVNLIGAHTPFDSCGDECGAFGAGLEGGPVETKWEQYYRGVRSYSPDEIDRLIRLYDAEIRQVDAILGRLVESIDRKLPPERTFVAVTSDHGENIGDHGHMDHVFSVHQSIVRIPLIIRHPPAVAAGSQEVRPVQLVDLFPSILRVAGVEAAAAHQGVDLFGDLDPERPLLSEFYRPHQAIGRMYKVARPEVRERLQPHWRRVRSVIEDDWKLVWGSDGRHELYDLSSDPDELRDRIDDPDAAERRKALQATLESLLARYGDGDAPPAEFDESDDPVTLDAETEAELRRLGYIR